MVIFFSGATGWAGDGNRLEALFQERLEAVRPQLIEFRRDLHRHPEVSGEEERTARLVAEHLEALGFSIRTGVGGHGVVGLLRGELPGPVIAFRADMDAVYSSAPDPVDFKSERPGVRHICGHDIHTTIGIALAEGFAAVRDRLPGSLLLIFQPAEERAEGANAMIADGALKDPRPAAIFSFHTAPLEVGEIATAQGTLMPGRDRVTVTVSGSGDRSAAAGKVREALQGIGTLSSPFATQPADSDFILARAGVIQPDTEGQARVAGTFTLTTQAARQLARNQIQSRLEEIEREFGDISLQSEYQEKVVAGVTNHPDLVERSLTGARSVLGQESVHLVQQVVPAFSEDFGSFQNEVPGVMFFLGVSNRAKGWIGMPHSPNYVADEDAIFVAARVMARIFLDLAAE